MPIRMVDDPDDQSSYNDNSGGSNSGGGRGGFPGGGGGGGLFALLPLLLGLFRSKSGLLILALGVAAYFFFGRGCNLSSVATNGTNQSGFSTGGDLDPKEFSKAPVYEGLTEDDIKNPLQESVSLLRFAPQRRNQGEQGSCVAWSSTYAARTILEAASKGVNADQIAFSPSYVYNQIGLDNCQGSYIIRAMELLQQKGAVPLTDFPYSDQECSRQPSTSHDQEASQYKIRGFTRLTTSEDTRGINIRAIKEHLNKDAPVVIGMVVGGSFMQGMMGQKVWHPNSEDQSQMGFGGHAICVIGYDDRLEGGAFQIMNSWGPEWGENGTAWIRYSDFKNFVREAYGIDALPKGGAAASQPFDCEIGLMKKEGEQQYSYIPLQSMGSNVFASRTLPKGTNFKIEVKNSTECYVYVFGQETDGSSYTLFPYPTKEDDTKTAFSPYCGITGYRLFPKGKMMQLDQTGTKDYMAVVVSKKELNWYQLNQTISQNRSSYTTAVSSAVKSVGNVANMQVDATGKGNMHFTAPAGDNGVAYAVVEINKQ